MCVVVGGLPVIHGRGRGRPCAERGFVLHRKCFVPCGRWWVTKYHYICAPRLCWQPNDNIEVCNSSSNEILWPYYLGIQSRENTQSAENRIIYGEGDFCQVCAHTLHLHLQSPQHIYFSPEHIFNFLLLVIISCCTECNMIYKKYLTDWGIKIKLISEIGNLGIWEKKRKQRKNKETLDSAPILGL